MLGRDNSTVRRAGSTWLAAVALAILTGGTSFAASPQCLQLEAELASLPQPPGSFVQSDEFAAAANTQQDQIDLARIKASDLGCGRAIAGDMIAECAALNAKIAGMENNLGNVDRQPVRPNKSTRRERIRILDAMQLAGCNDQDDGQEDAATDTEPLDDQIGGTIIRGGSAQSLSPTESYPQHIVISRSQEQATGEYRTLCVRTCDGYFFPMSNAAGLQDFQRDEKNCEASCPGTEIELFYHLNEGQPQDSMVSARSGQPYRNLPTAYRYKRVDLPRVPACGCNVSQNKSFSVIAGEGRPVPSAPQAKPVEEVPATIAPRPAPDPDRKVRAVGPTFLPDPQAATGLRVPGPTPAR